ncbi:MAG TPA: hypothetical protein VJA86_02310 [Candidatus Nanoarchaeia archaeon]|nr:hypothetical protein [Candidatus Nanoarchaeia archaeon]
MTDLIVLLIILIFLLMIFFRVYNITQPIYLFGVLQKGKNAVTIRIVSVIIIALIVYGLYFHLLWGFILYAIDYLIGTSHALIAVIKKHKVSYNFYFEGILKKHENMAFYLSIIQIVFWTFVMIYLYKIFILV